MSKFETTQNHKMINEKYDFIEQWLPVHYTSSVNMILKGDMRPPEYVRQVKNKKIYDEKIIDALYKVALFNKLQMGT
ncbi:hypothetical protein PFY12_14365 [Chryseobacterium camelliae]|uniref:Uncharacterized protein n=1 Tax=Chryseobacterium camelliae TaxID=1265445 RepID=A0ABY7QLV4_9FLAO|nr:hypothetical protein [Chryseobacterium camelliae]WBV60208.1 hypothetical protein PFY12_14365 [Chryseobacterium camelliae]